MTNLVWKELKTAESPTDRLSLLFVICPKISNYAMWSNLIQNMHSNWSFLPMFVHVSIELRPQTKALELYQTKVRSSHGISVVGDSLYLFGGIVPSFMLCYLLQVLGTVDIYFLI